MKVRYGIPAMAVLAIGGTTAPAQTGENAGVPPSPGTQQ
jgi:hypothetical protein